MKCIIDNCNRDAKSRGFCNLHYQRYRRSTEFKRFYNGRNICSIEGCGGIAQGDGYCSKHYYKNQRYNDPLGGRFYRGFERHNASHTPEYKIYRGIISRCYNKNFKHYHRYGGRGIKVCDRWLESFSNFLSDMGKRPFLKAQIDRINNDGDYSPDNCRWVDNRTNSRNRGGCLINEDLARRIKHLGGDVGLRPAEISQIIGLPKDNIRDVLRNKCFVDII